MISMTKNKDDELPLVSMDDLTDAIAEVLYRKGYKEIMTFDEVVQYALDNKKTNSNVEAFVISVKKNYDPQNENDKLVIIQGLLDKTNRPISLNGTEAESRVIHAKTIDKKFVEVLNGAETKIVKL